MSDRSTSVELSLDPVALADAEIELIIAPDGGVQFTVAGVPGAGCEELERLILEALGADATAREHTPEFYARTSGGLGQRVKAWLKKS